MGRGLRLGGRLRQDESEDAHSSEEDEDLHSDEFSCDLYILIRDINSLFYFQYTKSILQVL